MTTRVRTRDLVVGMFVCLPGSWISHSFLVGKFRIKSEAQIRKIRDSGFSDVEVDIDRSDPGVVVEPGEIDRPEPSQTAPPAPEAAEVAIGAPPAPADEPSVEVFERTEDAIQEITRSHHAPIVKAQKVYQQSLHMVEELFANPTASFIGSSKRVVGKVVDLILADDDTADCLLKVSSHDEYTYMHSVNVGVYATALAKKIYRAEHGHNMREIGAGFFLHDLGKISIPASIICKPGKLDAEEMAVIRQHPMESYHMLRETSQLSDECSVITLQHHEREDGTGYPFGLKGDEIHDYARICSIADVFDALTSKRSYRDPSTAFGALQIMRDEMLGHFHAQMLRDFVMLFAG